MIKQKDISAEIDEIWISRDYIKAEGEKYKNSCLPLLIVGPARSGKYVYAYHESRSENSIWRSISGNSHLSIEKKLELRQDPSSTAAVLINFPEYKAIQNRPMFFYRLQKEILSRISNQIFADQNKLIKAFEDKTGFLTESALNFFQVLSEILQKEEFSYQGRINIYLCGIQYIFPEILNSFLEYLRAFIDSVYGNPGLERFKLVLTSLQDGYYLTEKHIDTCSPLNSANRIYKKDFDKKEFKRFINVFEEKFGLRVDAPAYLYSKTSGDIYFTKVILTFCEANIITSKSDIKRRNKIIKKDLIDKAVDYILSPPTVEFIPPFRFLKNFINQYDEVRDVLYQLNDGASIATMTDMSGVYTLPESSGAVVKVEKDKKYGYVFRNEIYRRLVEKYIKEEEQKTEFIISESIGKGDMSFPATLASAIRHEMSGPIGVITAELSRLFKEPNMSAESIEYLKAIKSANLRLSTINSFLKGSWGQKPNIERIELNKYIKRYVSVFKPHLFRRKIQIKFDFDKNIKTFEIDTGALKVALINLIINARDAIFPRGSGTITIETKSDELSVELIIKDDGVGMDKYTLQRVMNYGFSTKNEGKGIGLTLCKTAVRRMNAALKVKSKVGEGTTIAITFRRKQNEK